jgi:predicted nucleic acid-binding protein
MRAYVLDASALMAFFEDRGGVDKVEELLAKAAEAKQPLAMSVINWGEVYYSVWRARGEKMAAAKLHDIAQLPIEIVGVEVELGKLAASLKAQHNLPYADCFAAALAQARKATLITSDRDFERVGTTLKIFWVSRCRLERSSADLLSKVRGFSGPHARKPRTSEKRGLSSSVFLSAHNATSQPRRLMLAPDTVGCNRLSGDGSPRYS